MRPASQHEITELETGPGELSFRALVGGLDKRLFIRSPTDLVPNADAALAGCLMPAMRSGGRLTMSDPISPRLLRTQREFQAIQRTWSHGWEFDSPPLHEVEVIAPAREVDPRQPTGRVAAFFSGGVDSWSTVLENPDLTDLIFVRGIDLLAAVPNQVAIAGEVEARLGEAAAAIGLRMHTAETNLRDLSDHLVRWETCFTSPLTAVALFFAPLFDRVLIAGDTDYAAQQGLGANHLIDHLWSTEELEIADDGGRIDRMEKTRRIASHPQVHRTLRVCWENPDPVYNCGHCRKCLMAMASLDSVGALARVDTFPAELDLEAISRLPARQVVSLTLREDLLAVARAESGNPGLVRALETAVQNGKDELGLPADYRGRSDEEPLPPRLAPADQEITELRREPGELSFRARIGELDKRLVIRTETDLAPNADAALAACLLPAMVSGGRLTMSEPISPRLLRTQREFQAIQRAWSEGWTFGDPPLCEVELSAPVGSAARRPPTGRVAAFLSGGAGSWSTVLDYPELTDLIFVRGVDVPLDDPEPAGEDAGDLEARLRDAAGELGLRLHTVETNLRELSDPLLPWPAYAASLLAAVALFFEQLFDRALITGPTDYETQPKIGSAWTIDSLWSNERIELVDAGGRLGHVERVRRVAADETARGALRGGLMTAAALAAIGADEAVVDLDLIRAIEVGDPLALALWEDVLAAAREAGHQDLTVAVGVAVDRGRERLELPAAQRSRHRPVAALRGIPAQQAPPTLFATPATAAALASATSAAFLVGSYDGSGNFGDIAQLDAALGLLSAFEPGLLVLPVIERACGEDHERALKQMQRPPEHVLSFGAGGDDGLVAVQTPPGLAFAACYLYGGGYLNPDWGDRKLAMLGAAEALALAGGTAHIDRICSGLQVDPDWLPGLRPPTSGRCARSRCWAVATSGRPLRWRLWAAPAPCSTAATTRSGCWLPASTPSPSPTATACSSTFTSPSTVGSPTTPTRC